MTTQNRIPNLINLCNTCGRTRFNDCDLDVSFTPVKAGDEYKHLLGSRKYYIIKCPYYDKTYDRFDDYPEGLFEEDEI